MQLGGGHVSVFDAYWKKLDTNSNGRIDATTAAAFLKKSRLSDTVLHKASSLFCLSPPSHFYPPAPTSSHCCLQIWGLSDPGGRGYLDKQVSPVAG